MTDKIETMPSNSGRRSLIKKAAVGGAIAWTAPTVLSSKVSAVEIIDGCTAKCAPVPTIAVGANTRLVCNTQGQKNAAIDFSLVDPDGFCPCNTGGGSAVAIGSSVTPNPAEIKSTSYDPVSNTGTIIIGGQGNGALGDGSYTAVLTYCTSCNDRSTNTISRNCGASINFTFSPANGNCSAPGNVGTASLNGQTCGAPFCGACAGSL